MFINPFMGAAQKQRTPHMQRAPLPRCGQESARAVAAGGNQKTGVRFCALVTLALLASVPSQRLLHPASKALTSPFAAATGEVSPAADDLTPFTADAACREAEPLLASLAPEHDTPWVSMEMMGRPDGCTQRAWGITCRSSRPAQEVEQGGEAGTDTRVRRGERSYELELTYDADTGKLVSAGTTCGNDPTPAPRSRTLSAGEAVHAARGYLVKLGLAPGDPEEGPSSGSASPSRPPRMVFPPERSGNSAWRVWLRGRRGPDELPLTVEMKVSTATGELIRAVVVERAVCRRLYLPRRPSRPAVPGHP
jgi:hypothetical protein